MSRRPALASAAGRLGGLCADALRWLRRILMGSLQVRIVTLTLALCTVAVVAVGTYMTEQIARGLYESKLTAISAQTDGYAGELESLSPESDAGEALSVQLRSMLMRSTTPLRSISIEPRESTAGAPPIAALSSTERQVTVSDLPEDFVSAERSAQAGTQHHVSIALPEGGPGLVVSQPVAVAGVGQFDLYVVADLSEEQSTLDFVIRAALVAGLVLIVLVGAVAWMVTRLVVVPVRRGAEVAREIADGDLDRRMPVHGRDEIGVLAESFNDMTETLQDQIERMEQLAVLQRRFVSDVSHELRTPLTTIQVASDMIYSSREDFDETTARSAELLHSQVERFEALLGDLLEISRFDAGAANLLAQPLDLTEIVVGVVESVAVVAERSGSPLLVHAPSAPVMAEIDRVRVTRIVRNLVVNAVEHGEGKPIEILIAANADAAAVSVRDHGVGMSADQVENVFDRFWRADPSRKRTLGGSGLGLAISLEDARLHGGWLQAWGELGDGSCFRLTLPRRQGQPIETSPLPLPPADVTTTSAIVAGPETSDGSVRIQTGSIPIVVEGEAGAAEPTASGSSAGSATMTSVSRSPGRRLRGDDDDGV